MKRRTSAVGVAMPGASAVDVSDAADALAGAAASRASLAVSSIARFASRAAPFHFHASARSSRSSRCRVETCPRSSSTVSCATGELLLRSRTPMGRRDPSPETSSISTSSCSSASAAAPSRAAPLGPGATTAGHTGRARGLIGEGARLRSCGGVMLAAICEVSASSSWARSLCSRRICTSCARTVLWRIGGWERGRHGARQKSGLDGGAGGGTPARAAQTHLQPLRRHGHLR